MSEPDELAEAERQIRHLGAAFPNRHGRTVEVLMAEYDRRGAIEQRARRIATDEAEPALERAIARYILGDES